MKKMVSLLVTLLVLSLAIASEADAKERKIGTVVSTLRMRETSYGTLTVPEGRRVVQKDDIGTTTVTAMRGNPNVVVTEVKFRVARRPDKLSDKEQIRDAARKAFIMSGVPRAVFANGGGFEYRFKGKGSSSKVEANATLRLRSGEVMAVREKVQLKGKRYYSWWYLNGKAVSSAGIVETIRASRQ